MENNFDDSHCIDALVYLGIKWKTRTLAWNTLMSPYPRLDLNPFIWCEYEYKEIKPQKLTHCECGKDKHGFASHSSWCAKENV